MKNKRFIIAVIFLLSLFMLILNHIDKNESNLQEGLSMSYLEDASRKYTISEIVSEESKFSFIPNQKSIFSFGRSESNWWIRTKFNEEEINSFEKNEIHIYNPTIADATLYLPLKENGHIIYKPFHSGWQYKNQKQDEGFLYPVFKIPYNTDLTKSMYLKLYSTFTQNYTIDILSEKESSIIKSQGLMLVGLMFGMLFFVVIYNLIIFSELRDKAYLYYFLYMLATIFYQGNLLGVSTICFPDTYHVLMSNTILMSLVVMTSAILFFKSFFNLKKNFPNYNKRINLIFIFIAIGIIITLMNMTTIANFYAHILSNIGSAYMIYVAIKALHKGFKQAKFFLVGWVAMIIALIISFARHSSWIANNIITINITFIAVSIMAIFLSAAFVGRLKSLHEEKEEALVLYKDAEKMAEINEIAFLQAQIKPHFLYNALNVIASLCRIDPKKARSLILDLARYLQHTFSYKKDNYKTSFSDELEYIEAYVKIEQARFKDKINIVYDIEDSEDLVVPALIIQPLIENAIRHGIRKGCGSGTVILRVKNVRDRFIIEVEDNGIGMTEEEINKIKYAKPSEKTGVGLTNIDMRLKKFYKTGIDIQSSVGKGTKISFSIPKQV